MTSTLISPDAATSATPAPAARPSVPAHAPAASRPWYRREPWLAVVLAGYVIMGVAFLMPERLHPAFLVASGALMLAAVALLLRQGLFRPSQ
jgi:hypothetical protein